MQRIYVVLSVLWIVAVVAISIGERPSGMSAVAQFDPDAFMAQQRAKQRQPVLRQDQDDPYAKYARPAKSDDPWEEAPREWKLRQQTPSADPQSATRYWETRSALAFLPPVVGYMVLFGVLPWIGRGFRSTHP